MKNDVFAILSDPKFNGYSPSCIRLKNLAEEIIDRWPYSVPYLSVNDIMAQPTPARKVRGRTEEGGRVAISGGNGWAFFDYHLAMFGTSEVNLN